LISRRPSCVCDHAHVRLFGIRPFFKDHRRPVGPWHHSTEHRIWRSAQVSRFFSSPAARLLISSRIGLVFCRLSQRLGLLLLNGSTCHTTPSPPNPAVTRCCCGRLLKSADLKNCAELWLSTWPTPFQPRLLAQSAPAPGKDPQLLSLSGMLLDRTSGELASQNLHYRSMRRSQISCKCVYLGATEDRNCHRRVPPLFPLFR